ncbi:MAG: polyketide cyclase [Bacteroidetes bacterium]|nr:MAG: polyketide cyclase [Bacteroidota bacterium]
MIKKILIGIGIILLIPFVIALFVKKEYSVEREIVIQKPKAEVFEYLKYLKNQDNFSKWATMDVNMKKSFTGTDGTVGAVAGWDSENDEVGKGEQEIMKITEGERIDLQLRFFEPFEGKDNAYFKTESVSDAQTKVKWGFAGKMNYPMNLLMLFMNFEKMIGDDFVVGLQNLKVLLEK